MHSFADLSTLLSPRSIVVIGASDQPGNLGGVAIRLLQKFGYPGAIWPINPRRQEVHGLPCYARVADVPTVAQLALFAIAADSVPGLVRECAQAGIRSGIAWAGGFAEIGGRGVDLQRQLAEACRETSFALAGPNCIGIIDSLAPMTASFASFLIETDELLRGNISMISQSGGTATMAQAFAQQAGFGFRYTISSGNEAVLTAADYLHALVQDPDTKVIAGYIEGVHDGERFVAALEAARAAGKPVVMLKGGATAASARAAVAHTGALAGENRVWEAIFRSTGVIHVHTLEELLDHALFLSSADLHKLPRGNGVAVVTFGGGGGVLSADQAASQDLLVPQLSWSTREQLRGLVPPIAAIDNPVDLTPTVYNDPAWFAHFPRALDTIAADSAVHSVLLQFGPMGQRGREVAQAICAFRDRTDKTVCFAWPLAPSGIPELLREEGAHVFMEYARAIGVLASVTRHAATPRRSFVVVQPLAADWSTCIPDTRTGVVSEPDCHRLLASAGLHVAAGRLARCEDEAANALVELGAPVAMKGISPTVTHRAAAGLLMLGIARPERAREIFRTFQERSARCGVVLDGVYLQRMAGAGIEILISVFRDPVFGLVVSCGAGGNMAELIDDVTLERAPVSAEQVTMLLDRLRIVRHARKHDAALDTAPLASYIARLSQLALGAPWQRFVLEVNPVKWTHDDVIAIDGLLVVEQ